MQVCIKNIELFEHDVADVQLLMTRVLYIYKLNHRTDDLRVVDIVRNLSGMQYVRYERQSENKLHGHFKFRIIGTTGTLIETRYIKRVLN